MNRHPGSDEALRLARLGHTAAQIAVRTGMSTRQVSRIRVRNGITKPNPYVKHQPDWALIGKLLDDGWSFREIERTHHIAQKTLYKRFPGRAWSREDVGRYSRIRWREMQTFGPDAGHLKTAL